MSKITRNTSLVNFLGWGRGLYSIGEKRPAARQACRAGGVVLWYTLCVYIYIYIERER